MAISYEGQTSYPASDTSASSFTFSHTVPVASNRLLLVGVSINSSSDLVTGVTYNGVSMTRIDTVQAASTSFRSYSYGLLAPDTGTHDVVVSLSSATYTYITANTYTGVSQTGLPDSHATGTDASGAFTLTTTVSATGCWLWGHNRSNGGMSAGSSTTVTCNAAWNGYVTTEHSNGTVGTGSQSLNMNSTPGNETGWVIVSFAPATYTSVSADLSTNLVSYWELEESSGTREDSHGANDLTDNNTVLYGTGKQGNGADFEATNSEYLNVASSLGAYNDTFTYSFWVNLESLPSSGNLDRKSVV